MTKYQNLSLIISVIVPILFLIITFTTGRWGYFYWSLLPSFILASSTFFAFNKIKKNQNL